MALLIAPIYSARPHIFTLPIIVIWTASLFRAARKEQAPPLWLLPLLWLWANLHATFTFGFVIAAFAGLDLLTRTRLSNPRLLARWIAFGLLCPLVSLINPYGVKAILATFTVAYGNEAVPFIIEWRPFDASEHGFQEVASCCCVFFGLLVSRLRVGWAKALFVLFTLHVYLTHVTLHVSVLSAGADRPCRRGRGAISHRFRPGNGLRRQARRARAILRQAIFIRSAAELPFCWFSPSRSS